MHTPHLLKRKQSASDLFVRSSGSPVSPDSFDLTPSPANRTPSAGIPSPGFITTTSPTTRSSGCTCQIKAGTVGSDLIRMTSILYMSSLIQELRPTIHNTHINRRESRNKCRVSNSNAWKRLEQRHEITFGERHTRNQGAETPLVEYIVDAAVSGISSRFLGISFPNILNMGGMWTGSGPE